MRTSRFFSVLAPAVVLILALVVTGCSDSALTDTSTPDSDAPVEEPAASKAVGLDAAYVAVAEENPGFGGAFFDDNGRLNVYVDDADDRKSLGDVVASLETHIGPIAERNPEAAKSAPIMLQGDYDFRALLNWRVDARPVLDGTSVLSLDVDERTNRVRVGVAEGADVASVESLLADRGIPTEAVIVEEEPAMEFMATLRDPRRPTQGGLQIDFGGGARCTLGFNAFYGGTRSYVTNSHCTNRQGGTEGTYHYQGGGYIGQEIYDPNYTSSLSGCPSGRVCRYSDTAIGQYSSGASSSLGQIARTINASTTASSLTINSSAPTITIDAETAYPTGGETLSKIGRTTGWTYGRVASTCQDIGVAGSNITLLCQDRVQAGVNGGDSGSPVFLYKSGSKATLYGILWGGGGGYFAFSSLWNVRQDISLFGGGQSLTVY